MYAIRERLNMKYIIKQYGRSIEISEANSSVLVYRIPYQNLFDLDKELLEIKNDFIVYILYGECNDGADVIYVGKSKNGLRKRPTSHEDKYNNWTYCYVLTQFEERTFFNDGTIQYIEDKINKRISELNHYNNTTKQTTEGTANSFDMEDCDEYLVKAYEMLDVIGLDLKTYYTDDSEDDDISDYDRAIPNIGVIPDGEYYLSWKLKRWDNRVVKGKMQVVGNKFIVLSGSDVCPNEGHGLIDGVRIKRDGALIIDCELKDDVVLDSPSSAAMFITGGSANGWHKWKTSDGKPIDIFRK